MEEKIEEINVKYGYRILILLLDHYEYYESFEVCQLLENKIKSIEKMFNINIKRQVCPEFLEDYMQDFWRLGLSGDIAYKNLPLYFKEALLIMEK